MRLGSVSGVAAPSAAELQHRLCIPVCAQLVCHIRAYKGERLARSKRAAEAGLFKLQNTPEL
jgi:hypothetical protein